MSRFLVSRYLALAPLLFCLFPGCGGSGEDASQTTASKPFAGVKLLIAIPPDSGLKTAWQSLLIEWQARTGAETEFIEWPSDALIMGRPVADLIFFDASRLPEIANSGWLTPLPASSRDNQGVRWNDIAKGLAGNVLSHGREPVAVPFSSPVPVLYFRRDLLERAGLGAPDTWEEYQRLLENRERWAGELPVLEPWGPEFRVEMLLCRAMSKVRHAGNYSAFLDIETGEPALNSPAWLLALQQAKAAIALMPDDVLNLSPADCRKRLLKGQAAMAVTWETIPEDPLEAGDSSSSTARADGMTIGVTRLPGSNSSYNRSLQKWETASGGAQRVDITGFSGLVAGVSSQTNAATAQAGWNLLGTLSEPGALQTAFPGRLRSLCRPSQVPEGRVWFGPELTDNEGDEFLRATAEALRDSRITFALPFPDRSRFRAALGSELNSAIVGEKSVDEAIAGMETEWKTILEKTGRERVRDCYRRQLGLPVRKPEFSPK